MYVATFYSFKGGVGRTLALLNVAYEMGRTGLNVLVVDFDLEAPAIHADRWRPPLSGTTPATVGASSGHPGIVEYVTTYMETLRAPQVSGHIVDATPDNCAGAICLMPAGHIDGSYSNRLSEIDWNELYADYDGYVMFEDMRAQWKALGYDYVLVDSRTGFTDVGGICTRHLPDAIVTIFRPDDQSLRGMRGVVRSIRREGTTPRRQRAIALHFVMASIPDADDEDGILAKHRQAFRKELAIPAGRLLEIKQYQSMDLLTQPIFTRTRPRTSLAGSYQELTKMIRSLNVGDRDGILEYLHNIGKGPHAPRDEEFVKRIRQRYWDDATVLGELAGTRGYGGSVFDAADLFERMASLGSLRKTHQMRLAAFRHRTGDHEGAAKALMSFFQDPGDDDSADDDSADDDSADDDSADSEVTTDVILRGLGILEERGDDRTPYVEGSPVIRVLPPFDQAEVAEDLNLSASESHLAAEIFERILHDADVPAGARAMWEWNFAFALMATGRFAEARALFEGAIDRANDIASIPKAFNRAMATWADSGEPDPELFRYVLELLDVAVDKSYWRDDANALQAFAVAAWFGGRREEADRYLREAEEAIEAWARTISCWSFTRVSRDRFRRHCEEIHGLLRGEDVKPAFMR